ncbi:alpha/beta fold hydrolase [Labedella endophytica]|uniref:Alpha/beta fold hydrolase n=1 Tax=Labedella endophytica TaxID=1523160 RepID=A0A433JSE5_9MICO|nr:alpha/beta fold hydrolase [Labedella endophytica]RUR00849.1 alpha/beta fold hydrolase [Labedella endophytica]
MSIVPPPPEPVFITTPDAVRLAVYDFGEPSAPVVLALHGFASSAVLNWHNAGWTRDLTRAGFRVLALDQRGHGRSGKPRDPARFSTERLAADALAVLDAHLIDDALLLGYSLGARVGWQLARTMPARFPAAVLGGLPAGDPLSGFDLDAARVFAAGGPSVEDRLTRTYIEMAAGITGNDLESLIALVEGMRGGVQPEASAPPIVPLLVAAGDRDPVLDDSRVLAEAAPHGEFLELPDRNHFSAPTSRDFRRAAVDVFSRTLARS